MSIVLLEALAASWMVQRDGKIIINESSVSRCAEREFRFVEPRSVRMGDDLEEGDSQMPMVWD